MPEIDDVPQMLKLGIAATERGEYEPALQLLKRVYQLVPPEKAPQGLSYYGLCLARVEKKTKQGAELCQKAIALESYEGKHWANLVRLWIGGNSRRKAVEALEKGLKATRNDKALLRVREEIGYRKAPYFRFLSRSNPLNKAYSKSIGKVGPHVKIIIIVIAAAIYIAMVVGVFFMVLK
jgi:tetratricopeptide (TPR) repeat protein